MCPLCLATFALATAGAATTTGWTVVVASKYLKRKDKERPGGSHDVKREV
jgi:hypothetical protein